MSVASERLMMVIKQKDVSYRQLEELTGIKKSSIANYVNGKRQIPIDKLKAMAKALNVDAAWLVGWSDEQTPYKQQAQSVSPMEVVNEQRLTDDEAELLDCYRSLNDNGKHSLLMQARMHAHNEDYLKDTQRKMA